MGRTGEMEHRATALYSKGTGRNACPTYRPVALWLSLPECGFVLNAGGGNGAQDYRPVLARGQAGMGNYILRLTTVEFIIPSTTS